MLKIVLASSIYNPYKCFYQITGYKTLLNKFMSYPQSSGAEIVTNT